MRVLICGTRHGCDPGYIAGAGRSLMAADFIIVGDAPGVDKQAQEFAEASGIPFQVFYADWRLGKKAGPIRNQLMVDQGPDIVLAFPDEMSIGTWDTIRRAVKAGIEVRIYPVGT